MKLQTLRPRVGTAPGRLQMAATLQVERLRGRAGQRRRERWLRDHPTCVDCEAEGRVGAGEEVDHVIPLWKGGADDESNLATRCKAHHREKTAREAAERARGGGR